MLSPACMSSISEGVQIWKLLLALISLFTDRFWQILSQNVCFGEYYSKITLWGKLNPVQEKVNNTFMLFTRLQIEGDVHDKIQFMKNPSISETWHPDNMIDKG